MLLYGILIGFFSVLFYVFIKLTIAWKHVGPLTDSERRGLRVILTVCFFMLISFASGWFVRAIIVK